MRGTPRQEDLGRTICDATGELQAGLVVMTTHGRSGLGRWLYGSVADQVLRRTDVPVLLVPAAGDRAWAAGTLRQILVPLDGSALAEEETEDEEVAA